MAKQSRWTSGKVDQLRRLIADGHTFGEAGKVLGMSRNAVAGKAGRLGLLAGGSGKGDESFAVANAKGGCEQSITSKSFSVKTVDDALRKAEIDLTVWEVDRSLVNSWQVAMLPPDGKPITRDLWQVKVWVKRRVPKRQENLAAALAKRIATHAPRYPKPAASRFARAERCTLEIPLFDAHFGKLAWARETGSNYDLKLAEEVYRNAVADLIDRTAGYRIDKIIFPVGSDFFHVNNAQNTTRNNTPQDVDGRWAKVYEAGCVAVVKAIEHCLTVAPVEGIWVGGNHDMETSWYLAHYLQAWFRNAAHVTIDAEPLTRKYREIGPTLLGFAHGNEEAHRDLPGLMASEAPEAWGRTRHRELHTGHFHKIKETHYVSADSFGPLVVRTLPSLSGTDLWHYRKGYTGSARAAEAYLWGHSDGYIGHFSARAREGKRAA